MQEGSTRTYRLRMLVPMHFEAPTLKTVKACTNIPLLMTSDATERERERAGTRTRTRAREGARERGREGGRWRGGRWRGREMERREMERERVSENERLH